MATRVQRAYGDFRDFADIGGGREALVPPGETRATTDPDVATKLIAARIEILQKKRRLKVQIGTAYGRATLGGYAIEYLKQKRREGQVRDRTLTDLELRLRAAVKFLGTDRPLEDIGVRDVKAWAHGLMGRPVRPGRDQTLNHGTVRHYLNALSGLFTYAADDEIVPANYNPCSAWKRGKPKGEVKEAPWFEVHEAALLLEAARTMPTPPDSLPPGSFSPVLAHALLATFLLTGGRADEVYGLTVDDISFDYDEVRLWPNGYRDLKNEGSARHVPLWPQLREILEPIIGVNLDSAPRGGLLFPSPKTGGKLTTWRKTLDAIGRRAGFPNGTVRTRPFRHTYATLRHQTLEAGKPVGWKTVADELGHSSWRQLEQRYAKHRPRVRLVGDTMAFRVEDYGPAYLAWPGARKALIASDLRRGMETQESAPAVIVEARQS